MIPLYTKNEFKNAKSKDKLLLKCLTCNNPFEKTKHEIQRVLIQSSRTGEYCSKECQSVGQITSLEVVCLNCGLSFNKLISQIKKHKNHFCSQSCSATYNNRNKIHGTRRSKLESWLEIQLAILYPTLHIDFNKKDAIQSELDIYIPALKLAFELNGIFHYEPIYGSKKLGQIQKNDISKTKACLDSGIDLCIIDVSGLKYFKPTNAQIYLDIITNIIKERLTT